jgi:hypothetical protein
VRLSFILSPTLNCMMLCNFCPAADNCRALG